MERHRARTRALLGGLSVAGTVVVAMSCGSARRDGTEARAPAPVGVLGVSDGFGEPDSPISSAVPSSGPFVAPAVLVPEATSSSALGEADRDGARRYVVSGIRLVEREGGPVARARDALPDGRVRVLDLPPMLGGGVLIAVATGAGTELFRASDWLSTLEPIASWSQTITDWVPGFDRIYVRTGDARAPFGDIGALDPRTGSRLEIDPLPRVSRVGLVAFSDPWRAVAVLDLLGAVATFDAGVTWRPLFADGRSVTRVSVQPSGEFMLDTSAGRFALGASGELTEELAPKRGITWGAPVATEGPGPASTAGTGTETYRAPMSPLGRRPLRTALTDGWPDSSSTVVVAKKDSLYRLRLSDGAVVDTAKQPAMADDSDCHALALGPSFGFLCSAADASTTVYAFEPPLSLRALAHTRGPRFVAASGTGGIAMRGTCSDEDASNDDPVRGTFCVRTRLGASREISLGKDADTERVAVLADGRVAVLRPPYGNTPGRLRIFEGDSVRTVALALPAAVPEVARGVWLNTLEEVLPNVLGTWVEVRHAVMGVRVSLDGAVVAGQGAGDIETTTIAGRFALDWGKSRHAAESVDGGMTWSPFEMPAFELPPTPNRDEKVACGPAGCAGRGWLRVGWSARAEATAQARALGVGRGMEPRRTPARGVSFACEPDETAPSPRFSSPTGTGATRIKLLGAQRNVPPPAVAVPYPGARPGLTAGANGAIAKTPWAPFRGAKAPALGKDELGLDVGSDSTLVGMRLYAWGPKGGDWWRSGRWMARFDDRFSLNGLASTTTTSPPFRDEDRAAEMLGLSPSSLLVWNARLDPSGLAAVLFGKRGLARSELYQAARTEPLLPWRDPGGGTLPEPISVARLGSTWFFLSNDPPNQSTPALSVWRVDNGSARRLVRFPRVASSFPEAAPVLTRRAGSNGLGLLVLGAPAQARSSRDWYVIPIDPESGAMSWPERLLANDLDGQAPGRCEASDEGWLVDAPVMPLSPVLLPTTGREGLPTFGSIELRLRLARGRACVEAISARIDRLMPPPAPSGSRASEHDKGAAIPLVATDETSGAKWPYRCWP